MNDTVVLCLDWIGRYLNENSREIVIDSFLPFVGGLFCKSLDMMNLQREGKEYTCINEDGNGTMNETFSRFPVWF